MADSKFKGVEQAPPIEVFTTNAKFNEDPFPNKVNLSIGAYRSEEGKPWVLPVVRAAEKQMAEDSSLHHEYLPIMGLPTFREAAAELLLGPQSQAIQQNRVECAQAMGGTGALRLAAEFCYLHLGMDTLYTSEPTWNNHIGVFKASGYENIRRYRYWDNDTRSIDIEGMCEDIRNASSTAVVILHACAHNPTGVDPNEDQWLAISNACKESGVFVLLDIAYQGFSTGDMDKDAFAVRHFEQQGFEFFVAQSFSKNFGLYNERVGNLAMILPSAEVKAAVRSQMELVIRRLWSNPPNHGGRIVATILKNPSYHAEWKETVHSMADRILLMRKMLFERLKALGTPGHWNHIIEQTGMFTYSGLTESQVAYLQSTYHIYMMKSGRINMCGLTTKNMEYVAQAIHDVVANVIN